MNGLEARDYNFITNNIKTAYISVSSGQNQTVVEVEKSKCKITTKLKGDIVNLDLELKINLQIVQEGSNLDITKTQTLKKLEQDFNEAIQKSVLKSIKKAQNEFESDIFGFGDELHIQHPKKWKEIKENWNDYFSKAIINVKVESLIDRFGQTIEPLTLEDE